MDTFYNFVIANLNLLFIWFVNYLTDVGYISTVAALITIGLTADSISTVNAITCTMGISIIIHNIPHTPGTTNAATVKNNKF